MDAYEDDAHSAEESLSPGFLPAHTDCLHSPSAHDLEPSETNAQGFCFLPPVPESTPVSAKILPLVPLTVSPIDAVHRKSTLAPLLMASTVSGVSSLSSLSRSVSPDQQKAKSSTKRLMAAQVVSTMDALTAQLKAHLKESDSESSPYR